MSTAAEALALPLMGKLAQHTGERASPLNAGIGELTLTPYLRGAVPASRTDQISYHADTHLGF